MITTILALAGDIFILLGEALRSGEIHWPDHEDRQ